MHVLCTQNLIVKKIIVNNHTKYLDIEMCSNICWLEQINLVSNKVRKLFYVFRDLRKILDNQKLRPVYKAIAIYIIAYGTD